ncbi:hypothetical protein EZV62_013807 [Acer yangbiense]|uniref:TRF2/HOY1 PH-like domain-containing protein n=1 Tax=Acer yangbiense TaxID=1000413 RepID=A0A5C7HQV3_9ROSI|nr:hypothetical protein EZV62_013807 [Acer yangbiense]
MAVEKSSVGNFKFDKQITKNVSTDLEAIGVSENDQNLVKALSSTRFRGLTGDYSFVDDQLQSLAFQIVNVNGYGTRGIGFWTQEKRALMEKLMTSSTKEIAYRSATVPMKSGIGDSVKVKFDSTTNKPTVTGYCIDVFDAVMKLMRIPRPEPEATWYPYKVPVVDLEMADDSLVEEHGPLNKRSKLSSTTSWSGYDGLAKLPIPPSQYNLLDQLQLGSQQRKSPSLLDSIQTRISQGDTALTTTKKESSKGTAGKLKASKFCASILRIGSWEYKPRYEGHLVAKCYFAKKQLVWEFMEGGLKRKIEIQWSDIIALKANMPEDGSGTLNDAVSGFQNLSSPAATLTHSSEHMSREAPSPMNDIGHYSISQQMTCGNQPLFEQGQDCPETLQVFAQCLLSNTQLTTASDEKSLMLRVNSFGCLLHKEPDDTAQNLQVNVDDGIGSNAQLNNTFDNRTRADDIKAPECYTNEVSSRSHPTAGMSRENSFGELLFNLPRITSLPKLLS